MSYIYIEMFFDLLGSILKIRFGFLRLAVNVKCILYDDIIVSIILLHVSIFSATNETLYI